MSEGIQPPKWPLRFLERICPDYLFEEIQGDLIEKFHRDLKKSSEGHSLQRAKRRFIWNAIRFFRPGIVLRNKPVWNFYPFYMLDHFFRIFFRTSIKNGGYSLINVSGLAVGLTCTILIMLWVRDEIAFDDFHNSK
jgi:putative ABC transport system permease protein